MRRRDFLYNTGLLLPALLASPALALASPKTINTDLLIVHNEETIPAYVSAVFNDPSLNARQINSKEISHLSYSKKGFTVTTSDNTTFVAQKIVIHAAHKINTPQSSVAINTGNRTFHIDYVSKNESKATPEFWFFKTKQFHTNSIQPFINRYRHAVLCLS